MTVSAFHDIFIYTANEGLPPGEGTDRDASGTKNDLAHTQENEFIDGGGKHCGVSHALRDG